MNVVAPTPVAGELETLLRHAGVDLLLKRIDQLGYRRRICEGMQMHFRCTRASVWRFAGEGDERVLARVAVCERGGFSEGGPILHQRQYGRYFDELMRSGVYRCADVRQDPKLDELAADYLAGFGVRALLDAAFMVNGRAHGVLCLEQLHEPRLWTAHEAALLRRAAATITRDVTVASGLWLPSSPRPEALPDDCLPED